MDKIKQLEQDIIKHKNLYYQGKPQISDFEYDKKFSIWKEGKSRLFNTFSQLLY